MADNSSLYGSTPPSGSVSSSNYTTLYNGNNNYVPSGDNVIISGTLTVNGCAILTDCSSFNLLPLNAANINFGGSATAMSIGAPTGITTIQNQLATANYSFPVADGDAQEVLATDGNGNLYWTSFPDLNTTYTIDASSTTGGANFNLVGSDATTDTIKFASGTNVTVSRTNANTITISSADTNTTYTQDFSSASGGTNLNLRGSDSSVDTVKFADGTGVTFAYTDANTATVSIGQSVATTASPTFANGFFNGNLYINNDQTVGNAVINAYSGSTAGTLSWNGANWVSSNGFTAGQVRGGNVTIGYPGDQDLSTTSGNLVINSTTGIIELNHTLKMNGTTSGSVSLAAPAVAGSQSYTLPTALPASNGYVLASTTGGTLSWVANPDTNTTYTIDASTTTGGANFNLVGSDATTDTIKIASGGGTVVTRTDANTITITSPGSGGAMSLNDLSDVTLTSPSYGNMFYYNNAGEWVNSSTIATNISANRPLFQYSASNPGSNSAIVLQKDYGATPFANGDGIGIRFEVDSLSQAATEFAILHAQYSTTFPDFVFATSLNDGTSYQDAMRVSTARVNINGDLEVDGDNGGTYANIRTAKDKATLFDTNATEIRIGGAGTNTSTDVIYIGVNGATYATAFGGLITQNGTTTQATGNYDNITQTTPYLIMSTTRKSMKGFVTVEDNVTGEIHSIEYLAISKRDTLDAYITIYAEVYSNAPLATFTVTETGSGLYLYATPLSANSTDISVIRNSLHD